MRRTIVVLTTALVLAGLMTGVAADAAAPSSQKNTGQTLADPGFSYFGGKFYLYGTGGRFAVREASTWNGKYTTGARNFLLGTKSTDGPRQATTCGSYGSAHWAPQIVRTRNAANKIQYVLYYSACHKEPNGRKPRNCVNIAVSRGGPTGPYGTVSNPICAPDSRDSEAIDASGVSRGGQRWLLFKTNRSSAAHPEHYKIWALAMNPDGVHRKTASTRPVKIVGAGELLEAPYIVNHGKSAWLFVSRNAFATCNYRTDVYRSSRIDGGWKLVGKLLTSANTGLCGPGGASITAKNGQTYIAYHAYKTRPKTPRYTYVAKLNWRAKDGVPYVP